MYFVLFQANCLKPFTAIYSSRKIIFFSQNILLGRHCWLFFIFVFLLETSPQFIILKNVENTVNPHHSWVPFLQSHSLTRSCAQPPNRHRQRFRSPEGRHGAAAPRARCPEGPGRGQQRASASSGLRCGKPRALCRLRGPRFPQLCAPGVRSLCNVAPGIAPKGCLAFLSMWRRHCASGTRCVCSARSAQARASVPLLAVGSTLRNRQPVWNGASANSDTRETRWRAEHLRTGCGRRLGEPWPRVAP